MSSDMEQFGESKKRRKIRISWKSEKVVKTFLEACIQEVENGTRGGSILWKNISEKLKDSHNFVAEQKQMKNHYDYLKAKYKAWSTLKNKVGNLYDPITNTFDLTEDQWDIEMKVTHYSIYIFFRLFISLCFFREVINKLFHLSLFSRYTLASSLSRKVSFVSLKDSY